MIRKMIGLGIFLMFSIMMSGFAYAQTNDPIPLEPLNEPIEGLSVFEAQAGISAYTKVDNVNLELAETALRNVEVRTDEYIIGPILLDNYSETWEMHVYVDTAGWIIVYHLKEKRASMIIDWLGYEAAGYQLSGSKLELALDKVATAMGVEVSDVKYYDFRYPDATNMMIVVDAEAGNGYTETFKIMLSGTSLEMYNMTWSHAIHCTGDCYHSAWYLYGNIKIDDEIVSNRSASGWGIWEGDITSDQLSSDIFHTVSLYHQRSSSIYSWVYGVSYVGIVLIYKQ